MKDFLWGTAISAFQTEMGSSRESVSDKSDWYVWVHNQENVNEGLVSGDLPENGDGFWDLYREDVENARWMGNNALRLSIDWARIFPDSTEIIDAEVRYNDEISDVFMNESSLKRMESIADMDAVEHYREIFRFVRSRGMKVILTLYHWPLPIWLHDPISCHKDINTCKRRGWMNDETLIEFAKFAQFSSFHFHGDVDVWETINEPDVIASQGYVLGSISGFPPAIFDMEKAFQVEKNLAVAHSLASRNIRRYAVDVPVGVGTAPQYFEPHSTDDETQTLVKYLRYVNNEWYLNAVNFGYLDMDLDGTFDKRLKYIDSPDYIGIDYYQRLRVSYKKIDGVPLIFNAEFQPCTNCSDFMWDIYPEGIRMVLNDVYGKYRKPLFILENGIADSRDEKRPAFLTDHIAEMEKAIKIDRIPVMGYFHWSLMDNYEWAKGFSMRFGLFGVDYDTKERQRRKSAEIYRNICRNARETIK